MMYTVERLMKAVRDAGRDGQPFTLGEVRAELGLKARDKRELKRFRSRFRECSQILGANLEKLGPNTYRLKPSAVSAGAAQRPAAVRAQPTQNTQTTAPAKPQAKQAAPQASLQASLKAKTPPPPPPAKKSAKKSAANTGLSALKVPPPPPVTASGPLRAPAPPPPAPLAKQPATDTNDNNAPGRLIDRVGVNPRRTRDRAPLAQDPRDLDAPTLSFGLDASADQANASQPHAPDPDELPRNTRAAAFREQPIKLSTPSAQPGFGARLSGWLGLGRGRGQNVTADNTAATALSRLAVELQPKSAGFEYQWRDGKVEIKRSAQTPGSSPMSRSGEPRAADK